MQGPRVSRPVKLLRFRNQRCCVPCSPLPDRARIISVVKTPKCQADETDAAEAVEEFHVEVTDYMVLRLCFRMIFVEHYVMAVFLSVRSCPSICTRLVNLSGLAKLAAATRMTSCGRPCSATRCAAFARRGHSRSS